MGGPTGSDKNAIRANASSQSGSGTNFLNASTDLLNTAKADNQPAQDYYKNLISGAQSGHYGQLITAAGPQISNITQQGEAAKENIFNTVPAGAGRDAALAMNKSGQSGQVAGTLNQAYTSALTNLSNLGTTQANIGLQEAGAGLRGLEGGTNSTNTVMQADAQSKASTMGFLGALAGGAGSALGGIYQGKG